MNFMKKSILILAALSLFTMTSCKKNAENAGDNANAPAEQIEQIKQAVQAQDDNFFDNWDKSEINGLLPYVPEDSAMVYASTRMFDIDNPVVKMLLDKLVKIFGDTIQKAESTLSESTSPEEKQNIEDTIKLFKSYRDMMANLTTELPNWGLHPKHMDSIWYMDGKTIVFKFTLQDREKFQTKLKTAIDEFSSLSTIKKEGLTLPTPHDLKVGDDTWQIYSFKSWLTPKSDQCDLCDDKGNVLIPTDMALHIDNHIVTMAFVDENAPSTLKDLLKPAKSPLKKEALGTIAEQTAFVGFMDNDKLFDMLTTGNGLKFLTKILDSEQPLSEVCIKEIKDIVHLFPKFTAEIDILADAQIINKATLLMSDADELKKLNQLHASSLDILQPNSLAGVAVNIDVTKALAYITESANALSTKTYQCEHLSDLPNTAKEIASALNDPQIKIFASGLSGINASLTKLDLKEQDPKIEAIANVTGPELANRLPMMTALLSSASPEIALIMASLKKDEVKEIDLSQFIQKPLKVNVSYNDTNLVAGTASFDVKSILAKPVQNRPEFIKLTVDTAVLQLLDLDLPESFSLNQFEFSLGTNDKGITFYESIK